MTSASLTAKIRRAALVVLSRDTLTALSAHYSLDVADRRVAANHVDALVRSRNLDFGELLTRLSRDELKTICEELQLPSDGREKQPLIERILGVGIATAAVETALPKVNGKGQSREGKALGVA